MEVLRRVPWILLAAAALLVAVGLVGIARSESLELAPPGLAARQAVWAGLAVVTLSTAAVPNYRRLRRWSYALFAAAIIALIAVYFFPPIHGARRWLRLGPVGFQPSEFAKLALVCALARFLMYRDNYRRLSGLLAPLALALAPMLLVLKEPDLGTALLFFPVMLAMLLAAGARVRDLAAVLLAGFLLSPLVWSQMSHEQRSRITSLAEQNSPGTRPTDDGYHLHQAKQMLALGGVWGSYTSGQAVEDATVYQVPEAPTDSIFAVLGERFGLVGVAALLSLYGLFAWRGLAIAAATREPFGRLIAVGLVSLVVVQALVNVAMMVGLAPITGLQLPLVSYGGSGLLTHAIALGLLVNVALRPGSDQTTEPFGKSIGS